MECAAEHLNGQAQTEKFLEFNIFAGSVQNFRLKQVIFYSFIICVCSLHVVIMISGDKPRETNKRILHINDSHTHLIHTVT